jgi:hypothetical protein
MGNISSRTTNKIELLSEEVNDFSFNVTNEIAQTASQNVTVVQRQNVNLGINKLLNCNINITQEADIAVSQYAEFSTVLVNPRELLRYYVLSPNSIYNQALKSNSIIMKDFMSTARAAFGVKADEKDIKLKNKITNILKTNLSTNSIQSCSQNIFVIQTQNVSISGQECTDSNINIVQSLVLRAAQSCFFEMFQNALLKDPTFRRAVREFNGDYDKGLTDENLDAGAKIPDACFLGQEPDIRVRACPPCEKCIIPDVSYVPSDFQTVVFKAWFVYGTLLIILLLMVIIAVVKLRNNKMK